MTCFSNSINTDLPKPNFIHVENLKFPNTFDSMPLFLRKHFRDVACLLTFKLSHDNIDYYKVDKIKAEICWLYYFYCYSFYIFSTKQNTVLPLDTLLSE